MRRGRLYRDRRTWRLLMLTTAIALGPDDGALFFGPRLACPAHGIPYFLFKLSVGTGRSACCWVPVPMGALTVAHCRTE